MAVCDYTYDEDSRRLKINCLGCVYGASVEDYDSCMAMAIDKLLANKNVGSIVLAKEREYEYTGEQVAMLVEIAKVIEDVVKEKMISYSSLKPDVCGRCYPDFPQRMQYIAINLLRRDPVGAYVELIREGRELMIKIARKDRCHKCYRYYKEDIIDLLKKRMEATKIVQLARPHLSGYHVGGREIYRQIFTPSVRPNFMLTRYMITPPENGKSIDRYNVGDIQVEIYKIPHQTHYFYHVIPPEFSLSEEKYAVMDAARRYMASHRPKTAEFVRSEKVREIFYNIGRDMLREVADKMGIYLTSKEIDQMANILTRYTAGLGVLEVLLADEKIQDVYINSPIETQPIMVFHQNYQECQTNLIPTREDAESWATRLRIQSGRPLDEANPVLDTDIAVPGGKARFAVITKGLSPEGFGFAIRRHRDKPWTLPLFIKAGMLNPMAAGLMSFLVDGSVSILVAGGRGAGKTSVLGSLMLELLPKVRIVTIEDSITGDCEIVYEKNGEIKRGEVGELIDNLIKKYGESSNGREIVKDNPENIRVYSIDKSGKVRLAPVSKFIRHKVNKDIYEVATRTGRKIKVTGDHSLFTLGTSGEIEPIEVRKLEAGDKIVTPRILPNESAGIKSIDMLKHMDKFESAYITGPRIGSFIKINRKIVSAVAKESGYFISGQLRGTIQWWKRNNIIPFEVLKESIKRGCKLNSRKIKFKDSKISKPIPVEILLDRNFLTFAGLWIADGCYDKNSVIISVGDKESRNIVRRVASTLGVNVKMHSDKFSLMINSKTLKDVMIRVLELRGDAFSKRMPPWIFGLSKKQIGFVLKGLFSGDGCVSDKEIMLSLRSESLIRDVQTLLLTFGVIGRVSERGGFFDCRISSLNSLKSFEEEIGILQNYKVNRLKNLCKKISSHDCTDTIPLSAKVKEELSKYCPRMNRNDYIVRGNNIGRTHLGTLMENCDLDYEDMLAYKLRILASSDILWDEVRKIKRITGKKPIHVYDFSVPGFENFICENILAHNTLELPISQLRDIGYNIESLKSRSVITMVESEMPAEEALRTALRLGDSALIIGEIRSKEASALYEAMRIGALSNVVAGTIHGESPYGVYDRVVNDLGVPPTSFKATDIINICKSLRSADGLRRFRRMTEITEVRKHWETNPQKEGGFVNLMEYSGKEDTLKPTDTLVNGESEVINRVASYVKEWSGNWEAVWENIKLRAKIKDTLVKLSEKLKMPELIEADWVTLSNSEYHLVVERLREEIGAADPKMVYDEWEKWLREKVRSRKTA